MFGPSQIRWNPQEPIRSVRDRKTAGMVLPCGKNNPGRQAALRILAVMKFYAVIFLLFTLTAEVSVLVISVMIPSRSIVNVSPGRKMIRVLHPLCACSSNPVFVSTTQANRPMQSRIWNITYLPDQRKQIAALILDSCACKLTSVRLGEIKSGAVPAKQGVLIIHRHNPKWFAHWYDN